MSCRFFGRFHTLFGIKRTFPIGTMISVCIYKLEMRDFFLNMYVVLAAFRGTRRDSDCISPFFSLPGKIFCSENIVDIAHSL